VALVRTVFEEIIAFIIRVERIIEIETMLAVKDPVIWYVTPCGSCKYRCFGGKYRLHHQDGKNQRDGNNVRSE
jgi:hypothetical protein